VDLEPSSKSRQESKLGLETSGKSRQGNFIKLSKDLKRDRPQFGQRKYSFAQTPTKLPALLALLPAMSASAAVASASVAASIRASNVSIAHASRVSAAILRNLTEAKVLRRPRAAIAVR
jgi:hypothetical protein